MHDGLGQEWMQMIVVDDFPSLDYAEGRTDLRVDPPAGLGRLGRNGVRAVVTGKSVSLRRCNADFPVKGRAALNAVGRAGAHNHCFSSGREGQ